MAAAGRADHHCGLLVADIERSAAFYVEALGGRRLTNPVVLEGQAAEMVMDAPPGTRYAMCLIGLEAGGVELFQFLGPELPAWAQRSGPQVRLPHLAVQVDDVAATLERVEHAGGTRLFDRIAPWGDARVIYVTDLDGNVIELLDASLQTIVGEAERLFPDARV